MPDWEISIPAYGAPAARLLRRARDRRLRASSATRWAASSPPRRRSTQPDRFEKLVLVSAAGVTQRAAAARADRGRGADARRRRRPMRSTLQDAGLPAPAGPRDRASAASSATRAGCGPELLWEFFQRRHRRRRASPTRSARSPATTSSTASTRSRSRRLIVWGRNDHVVPARRRARVRAACCATRDTVVFDDCGHLPQARAPGALQPAAAGGASLSSVIAPSEAERDACCAYLAITPVA